MTKSYISISFTITGRVRRLQEEAEVRRRKQMEIDEQHRLAELERQRLRVRKVSIVIYK